MVTDKDIQELKELKDKKELIFALRDIIDKGCSHKDMVNQISSLINLQGNNPQSNEQIWDAHYSPNKNDSVIKNPIIKYYGSKYALREWIISFFPSDHVSYVEVFGGSGAILLNKPRSFCETYNDKWGDAVNFFRVMQNSPAEFIWKCKHMAWARTEYKEQLEQKIDPKQDPMGAALQFYIGANMAISNMPFGKNGYKMMTKTVRYKPACQVPKSLEQTCNRLIGVQIENLDFFDIMAKYEAAAPHALFYLDPPYVKSTRVSTKVYAYEWTNEQHIQASEVVKASEAYIVISGYDSELYKELYEQHGWRKFTKQAKIMSGKDATECVWINPATHKALLKEGKGLSDMYEQKELF